MHIHFAARNPPCLISCAIVRKPPFAEIGKRHQGTRTRVTCPVPSRWLRECRPSGLRPLLGLNLRGKILPRPHPPRIRRWWCQVLQECVLLRRCTLPSTSPETQPHLPSGAPPVRLQPHSGGY